MTRTFRNRKECPKWLKVRDGKRWAAYDQNNNEYYFDTHAHIVVRYSYHHNPLKWHPSLSYTGKISPLEEFFYLNFKDAEYRVQTRYIKHFKGYKYSDRTSEGRHMIQKSFRREQNMLVAKEFWEKMPIYVNKGYRIYW